MFLLQVDIKHLVLNHSLDVPVSVPCYFLDHKWREFGQTHVQCILRHERDQRVMLEVGIVLQQTLQHLICLLVVDHIGQVIHDLLDQRVDHVDREGLDAHVQYSAALDVLGEGDRVFVDYF